MIYGAHVIVFTPDADADRAFFRDVLEMDSVDSRGGWLIFEMPPSEIAFHPAEATPTNELYFLCDDLASEMARLGAKGVVFSPIDDERLATVTRFSLPSGTTLALYQPKHPMALKRR